MHYLNLKRTYWAPEGDQGAAGAAAGAAPAAGTPSAGAPAAGAAAAAATPTWREDWRQQITTDEKELAQLGRYASPADVWKKARALEQRMSSGELKTVLPKDATPDQVKQWRSENGIPEAPDKYELKLREGLVIGDEDKPYVQKFMDKVHAKNVNTEQASAFIEAYYDILDEENARAADERGKAEKTVEDGLRAKWGEEYRGNQNRIQALLEANLPVDSKLKGGLASMLKGNQEFAELMEGIARQVMPVTTLIPSDGRSLANSVEDEIKGIEELMRKDRDAYNRDDAKQKRLRELYDYRERNKQKAA